MSGFSEAYYRFIESMQIDYIKWHDGIGYDLEALRGLAPEERQAAESLLIARSCSDWRDIEALEALASGAALSAIRSALTTSNYEVRIAAVEALARRGCLGEPEIEASLVDTLPAVSLGNGQSQALRLAENYPTPAVRCTLLWCALYGQDDIRVHAAALIYYLYGIAAAPFDWDYRPFYLRFAAKNLAARRQAYLELCEHIQVDPCWAAPSLAI